jgi:hypothetical protein
MRHSVFALVGAGALAAVLAGCETRDDTIDTAPPATTPPVTTPPPAPPPPMMQDTLMQDTLMMRDTIPGATGTGPGGY